MRMDMPAHPLKTLLPLEARLANWCGLIKTTRIVPLPYQAWGLLIEGCGFRRMLDAELLHAPGLLRPIAGGSRVPRRFFSAEHARRGARQLGLKPDIDLDVDPPSLAHAQEP